MLPLSITDDTWFQLMPSGAVVYNAELKIIRYNTAALSLLGLTRDEMDGLVPLDPRWVPVDEDYQPLAREALPAVRALTTGQRITGVLVGVNRSDSGEYVWLRVNAHPLLEKRETTPRHVLTTLEDVTEWKKALDGAKLDRQLFGQGTVVVMQRRGNPSRLTYISKNLSSVFGFDPERYLSGEAVLWARIHPDDQKRLADEWNDILASRTIGEKSGEFRLLDAWNRWRVVAYRTVLDPGGIGREPSTLAYWIDRTEEAENLRRLTMTLEAARTGTWDWTREKGNLEVDEGWAQLIGTTRRDLGQMTLEGWKALVHPDDLGLWAETNRALDAGEQQAFDVVVRLLHRSSRWVWIRVRGKVLDVDADGKPLRILGTQEDISDSIQAEQERSILSQVVEQGPIAIILTDLNGTIEYVNRQFTTMSGYGLNEVQGKNPRLLKSPQTSLETYAELWASIKGGRPWFGELQNLKKDGTPYWVQASISPISDASGSLYRYVAQHIDITARKRVEEASRAQYRFQVFLTQAAARLVDVRGERVALALAEILGDLGVHFQADRVFSVVLEAQGSVLTVSNGWDRSGAPLPGPMALDATPLWRKRVVDREPLLSTGIPCPVPWSTRPVSSLLAVPLEGGLGEPGYLILEALTPRPSWNAEVQVSVTVVANTLAAFVRRVKDELDLKKARLEADQANRAKTEFLAHMSHEIRTPMNGILGLAELALARTMDSEARSLVEGIKASGETLLSLVNDILDVSKIEAGKLELESTSFSLLTMVEAALSPLRVLATKKGLALNLDWAEGLDDLREGDPTRIRQILINLIGNALKFTSQGSVGLSIGPGERDGLVRFAVRDTGPGVPESRQGKLFLRYSQLEASTNRQFGGTGLGLSICRELVERMGGSLGYLDAHAPQGSIFWFSIPLAPATAPVMASTPFSTPEATRRELRVLVVEDNPVNQQVATGLLRRHGVDAVVSSNGLEALDKLTVGAFDLVLMDVQMPVLDGLTATRAIRRGEGGERHRHVPIVAMTANAMQGDKDASLAAGMDDYITKPISAAKIAALLEKWDQPPAEASPEERRRRVFDPEEMRSRLQLEDEFVQQIVQLFLDDLPTRRRNLVSAYAEGRLEEVHRLAHTLKGTAANLVAQAVVESAQDLETAAAQGDSAKVEPRYQAVLIEIDQLEKALTEFLR